MIDAFTRLTVGVFIKNKKPETIVHNMMLHWMKDNPKMDPVITLAWAVTAKNSYQMHGEFSSFQLVFRRQPNLPNLMTDKLPPLGCDYKSIRGSSYQRNVWSEEGVHGGAVR